jgi:hypothetical protein
MNQIAQLEKLIKIQVLITQAEAKCIHIKSSAFYDVFWQESRRVKDLKTAQEVMERIESYYNTKLIELYQSRLQELMPEELTITNVKRVDENSPQEIKDWFNNGIYSHSIEVKLKDFNKNN